MVRYKRGFMVRYKLFISGKLYDSAAGEIFDFNLYPPDYLIFNDL